MRKPHIHLQNSKNSATTTDTIDSNRRFERNELTWTGYLLYGYWSYLWAAFGAFVPFLISEFKIDYATAALHFSALAFGPFVSGFFGDKIIRGLGLAKTIKLGIVIMLGGALLTITGRELWCTISGALLIGFGGNIMSQSLTSSMSERFGKERAIGISEIQLIGSVFTLLGPLVVSTVCKFGLGWRNALGYSLVAALLLLVVCRNSLKQLPTASEQKKAAQLSSRLSPTYWLFFTVIFFSVASEWSIAFWCPEFLGKTFNLSKPDAAFGMSLFVSAMIAGRMLGPRLLKYISESKLLATSATLAAAGFLAFWLARDLPVNLIGLFILGLGESNVYPLCLSQAIASSSGTVEKAAARMSLSTGSAILLAPLLLGMLADKIGIKNSYGMIACSLILAAISVVIVQTFAMKQKGEAPALQTAT